MTYSRREEIFSKDYISIEELSEILGLCYSDSAKMIRDIKRGLESQGKTIRLKTQGKVHVQDYLDYFNLPSARYGGNEKEGAQ